MRRLDGIADVSMPDFTFWRPETAPRLALARDYLEHARRVIREMHRRI